jgi:hypothetical protein
LDAAEEANMRRLSKSMLTGLVAALVVGVVPLATASPADASPFCGIYWGSLAEKQGDRENGPITNVRAGRHACFDRLVFDLRGRAAGYRVAYVSDAAMGIPLRGGTQLRVVVLASRYPAFGCGPCAPPRYNPPNRREIVNLGGFQTIRQVALGHETENWLDLPTSPTFLVNGTTEFGVGVRARLPFRVFKLHDKATSRLVIDVAHRW